MRKKRFVLTIIGAIVAFTVIGVLGTGLWFHYIPVGGNTDEFMIEEGRMQWTETDMLSVSENMIINGRGEEIVLTGVNLGGWLLQEYWMCPVKGNSEVEKWTHLETIEVLENRFGTERTQELIDTYEKNWIVEEDIHRIAEIGCNVIRVPFWYRNFMSDADGTWLTEDMGDNPGFQRLDWIIDMAEKYGLYVILDMHGCPGGQTMDHVAGSARKSELFSNKVYQDAMEELWVAIAQRYQGNPVVAAYDIMNEPMAQADSVDTDPRNLIYDHMIKAIRKVDSEHIVIVEGIWTLSVLPKPAESGWDNVVYAVHLYGHDDVRDVCQMYREYSDAHKIPVYIGEYSDMDFLKYCQELGVNSTSWTYKGNKETEDTWFMYYADRMLAADVCQEPYWLIKLKWGNCLKTKYFQKNEKILSCWSRILE